MTDEHQGQAPEDPSTERGRHHETDHAEDEHRPLAPDDELTQTSEHVSS